jgi:hypothetical protein
MTIIEEDSGTTSETSSSISENNSRNFRLPERDFIKEISLQRERLMTSEVGGM